MVPGFGRGVFQILALSLMLAFGVGASVAQEVKTCLTNLGSEGQLLAGYPGVVYSPLAFQDVQAEGSGVTLCAEVRESKAVLASGEDLSGAAAKGPLIKFLRGDDVVVHECTVTIATFDPEQHGAADMQVGNCNLTQVAGLPQLMAGHAQVWELPQDLSSLGIWPVETMNISTLSERWIYLLGNSPGIGMLFWAGVPEDGFSSINLCAFEATGEGDAPDIGDRNICKDKNGAPMRLSVGQTVEMPLKDSAGNNVEVLEKVISLETVAEVVNTYGTLEYSEDIVLKALAPGSTSLTVFFANADDQLQARICEIVVE